MARPASSLPEDLDLDWERSPRSWWNGEPVYTEPGESDPAVALGLALIFLVTVVTFVGFMVGYYAHWLP